MIDMIGSVIKNLCSRPATRLYPFEKRETFDKTRGAMGGIKIEECIFCGICERKCPPDAIRVDKASKTWEIDKYKCIVCGYCVEVCPKKCLYMVEDHLTSAEYKDKLRVVQEPEKRA